MLWLPPVPLVTDAAVAQVVPSADVWMVNALPYADSQFEDDVVQGRARA